MDVKTVATELHYLFGLKHIIFNKFDTSPLGLSINKTQERVLMMAWQRQVVSMQFLSREAALEKGSLTTVIDSLEEAGLVRRERVENDRRSFIVKPTPAGVCLAERIDALFCGHLESILRKLPPEDRAEFETAAATFARLIPILAS